MSIVGKFQLPLYVHSVNGLHVVLWWYYESQDKNQVIKYIDDFQDLAYDHKVIMQWVSYNGKEAKKNDGILSSPFVTKLQDLPDWSHWVIEDMNKVNSSPLHLKHSLAYGLGQLFDDYQSKFPVYRVLFKNPSYIEPYFDEKQVMSIDDPSSFTRCAFLWYTFLSRTLPSLESNQELLMETVLRHQLWLKYALLIKKIDAESFADGFIRCKVKLNPHLFIQQSLQSQSMQNMLRKEKYHSQDTHDNIQSHLLVPSVCIFESFSLILPWVFVMTHYASVCV
ncbi:MAG: hypothetical protein Sylvanvirus7_12 [Sylvanvirus sp.]|uniref:Uncharacterized protein n=1 Tax=Sylvanvirus sp. TaxID=2487774 RepID=A0A3G5AJB9_9VIRU|nr:MAG: hypothetical protein Sylvanvirus7_12 [Sylvanvirus sp.]